MCWFFSWAHTADSHIFAKKKTSFPRGIFSDRSISTFVVQTSGKIVFVQSVERRGGGGGGIGKLFPTAVGKSLFSFICVANSVLYSTTTTPFPYGFWKRRREKVFFLFSVISPPFPPLPFSSSSAVRCQFPFSGADPPPTNSFPPSPCCFLLFSLLFYFRGGKTGAGGGNSA